MAHPFIICWRTAEAENVPSCWNNSATDDRVTGSVDDNGGCTASRSPAPRENLTWGPPDIPHTLFSLFLTSHLFTLVVKKLINVFFTSMSHPSSCILSLLPPQTDSTITSRLRSAAIYPQPATFYIFSSVFPLISINLVYNTFPVFCRYFLASILFIVFIYTVSQKKLPLLFYCNFGKFWSIFKILSMSESERNGS